MRRVIAVLALCAVPAALADVTGDKWEGTWRVSSGALAGTLVFKPATDAATRVQAPPCAGKRLYAGAYSGRRNGTIAACAGGFALAARLYEAGRRVGDFSITWELAVSPDGTVGAPTFRGRYSAAGARGAWAGTWLRHGGTIPKAKPKSSAGGGAAGAVAKVEAILRKNKASCEMTWTKVVARRLGTGYAVTATVSTFGNAGRATWNVVGSRVAPAEPLAADISIGCP